MIGTLLRSLTVSFVVCVRVRVVLYVWPCRVVHRCRRILLCPNRFHSSTRPSSSPVIDPEQNFRLVLLAIHAEFYPDRLGSAETMAFLSRRNGYRLLPELGRAQLGGSGAQLGAGARERRHRLRSRGQRGGEKPLSFGGAIFSSKTMLCQDRLGTNIMKTNMKQTKRRFLSGEARLPALKGCKCYRRRRRLRRPALP
jgi:hypothetical protein